MKSALGRVGLPLSRTQCAVLATLAATGAFAMPIGQAWAQTPTRPAAANPAPAKPAANAPSLAPGANPGASATAEAEAAYAASKAAFDALNAGDRSAVQEALIWTGDYQGVADGEFGRRTREALVAFEKRVGNNADGMVDAAELAKLRARAQELKTAVGFTLVPDPVSGAQIGVPRKLLSKTTADANGQTYAAADDSRKLSTFVVSGADADLAHYFETASAARPDRRITYKVLKPDFLVVSGESGGAKTYTRVTRVVAGGQTVLRGFTLSYPSGVARDFNPVALAIANSFNPQGKLAGAGPAATPPSAAATLAAAKDTPAQAATAATPVPPARPPAAAPGPMTTVTATLLAAGKAMAVLPASCVAPAANGAPLRILAGDPESGLALLEVSSGKASPVSFSATPIADGAPLVIVGFAETFTALAPSTLSVAPGEAIVDAGPEHPRVTAPLQPPAAGSAVFDRAGQLAGVIGREPREPRRFAGIVPLATHPVIPLRRLLQVSAIAGAVPPKADAADAEKPRSVGDIISSARISLIAIDCPR